MRRPMSPVKKTCRPPERDRSYVRSYVDSPASMERQLAAALEATRARLEAQREAIAKAKRGHH
jgi:hypothetical protein